jgi:Flp pilus assembly protein TadG
MRRSGHTNKDDRGVVALELVLVAPFLIALIFSIAQFGIFFANKIEVESAARDAARTLALNPGMAPAAAVPSGMTLDTTRTNVGCVAGNTTSDARINLASDYTFSIPGIPIGTKTIRVEGRMRCGG